jgi:hypothetical protein
MSSECYTLRVPEQLMQRAARLVPALKQTEMALAYRVGRASVLRLAMIRGLTELEREHGVEEALEGTRPDENV